MKSDHPAYFKEVSEKLISKEFQEFQESFITLKQTFASEKILTYVKSAFDLLQAKSSNEKDLAYSAEASKNLYDYTSDDKEQEIYREILEDCDGSVVVSTK
jgi:hypothetical protein